MDIENMRLQEGILLERNHVTIGVFAVSKGAGATFISYHLDRILNERDRKRFFVSRPDRFRVLDEPDDPDEEDVIVGVIDPLPSRLMDGADRIRMLADSGREVLWIINRDNPGVNRRAMEKYLTFRPSLSQEEISREIICRAEYNCVELSELVRIEGVEKLAQIIKRSFSGPQIDVKLSGNDFASEWPDL